MAEGSLACTRCSASYALNTAVWACACGGPLQVQARVAFPRPQIARRPPDLWRYREALAIESEAQVVTLGEGLTPLVPGHCGGLEVLFKADFLCPTGSFKDRGTSVMVSQIRSLGIERVVEDSSGNAGASVAAYCTRAGIQCDIYAPAYTSAGKLTQIAAYGARLVKVPGPREETTRAALEAARSTFYASHNRHPFFLEGVKTLAFEIWEQLGWRPPDNIVVPVGSGSLVMASYLGFGDLCRAGELNRQPRIFAVQSEACAPLERAWERGQPVAATVEKQETAAEGIVIAQPFRDREVLAAVRETAGSFTTVSDAEVWATLRELGRQGLYVEPTAAAAPAGVAHLLAAGQIRPGQTTVVVLTGSGLKATDKIVAGPAGFPSAD